MALITTTVIIGLLMLIAAIAWADDFFSRNWDSIYDPRSKYQIWRDNRRKQ